MTAGAKNKKQNYAGLGQLIRLWRVLLGEFDDLIGWSIESIGMMGGWGGGVRGWASNYQQPGHTAMLNSVSVLPPPPSPNDGSLRWLLYPHLLPKPGAPTSKWAGGEAL